MIHPGHLPDKCGDRRGKKWDKNGIKMAENAQGRKGNGGRAVFFFTALSSARATARGARVEFCSRHAVFTWWLRVARAHANGRTFSRPLTSPFN